MKEKNLKKGEGIVIRIQGPVVDVRFMDESPGVFEALEIDLSNGEKLILETEFLLESNEIRALTLGPSFGLTRGTKVKRLDFYPAFFINDWTGSFVTGCNSCRHCIITFDSY